MYDFTFVHGYVAATKVVGKYHAIPSSIPTDVVDTFDGFSGGQCG